MPLPCASSRCNSAVASGLGCDSDQSDALFFFVLFAAVLEFGPVPTSPTPLLQLYRYLWRSLRALVTSLRVRATCVWLDLDAAVVYGFTHYSSSDLCKAYLLSTRVALCYSFVRWLLTYCYVLDLEKIHARRTRLHESGDPIAGIPFIDWLWRLGNPGPVSSYRCTSLRLHAYAPHIFSHRM